MEAQPGRGLSFTVSPESFESLQALCADPAHRLRWECPFTLPRWMQAWWNCFGNGTLSLLAVRQGEAVVGVAPLMVTGATARLIGDGEVCDHLDIVAAPGATAGVLDALRRHLLPQGVRELDLMRVRPDSTAASELVPAARGLGLAVDFAPRDMLMELELPGSWEEYLLILKGKQRHELRRKFRRLEEAADFRLRLAETATEETDALAAFLRLFRMNRSDKAQFMTRSMERYFTELAAGLAAERKLRMFSLELDGTAAAVAFCFQLGQRMYLYNNAYDDRFRSLSPGLLNKALSIRESIGAGLGAYDFLRGDEGYKHHLGGRPVTLYSCRIGLD
jgi:CelD/BcsL family acetyltransferase involved in cellulose biosynthesis